MEKNTKRLLLSSRNTNQRWFREATRKKEGKWKGKSGLLKTGESEGLLRMKNSEGKWKFVERNKKKITRRWWKKRLRCLNTFFYLFLFVCCLYTPPHIAILITKYLFHPLFLGGFPSWSVGSLFEVSICFVFYHCAFARCLFNFWTAECAFVVCLI